MLITIRSAVLSDVPAMLAIERLAPRAAHWTPEQYNQLVDDESGVVLVAEEAGKLCGFVCAKVVAGEWEIENVVVAGEFVGALDLFRADPGLLGAEQLAGALVAAELAQMPLLDLLGADLQTAVTDPGSDSWAELNTLSRAEVSQATGMLVAQLEVAPAVALVRLRAHAYATGRSATDVARDILDRRLRLEAS